MEASLAAANVLVTINKVLNYTATLVGNLIAIVFYIVFSPFICLIMLVYPTEQAEPEELVELVEPDDPFEQSEESKEIMRKLNIRF